jgi:TRAP transporter TAXI family solute receptor
MIISRRHLWAVPGLLLLALVLLVGCGGGAGGGQGEGTSGEAVSEVVFGTSSQGSEFHSLSVAMADQISRQTDIAVSVQSVGGSEATVRAINDGKTDIGMANSLATTNAFEGEEPFEEPLKDIRLMIQGHNTLRQLIVRADSGIETPADLEGKRIVGERPALVEIRQLTDALLEVYDVPPDSVEIISTNETNEALDALRQGSVDAAVVPGSAGSAFFSELAQNADVRWIDFSERIDEILDVLGPAFVEGTLPAGTYKGQDEAKTVVALPSTLAARADLPEDAVYEMTKVILENSDAIAQAQRQGENWTVENSMSITPTVPFHPGAVRYYEDVGAWTEEMQQTQDELLQK